MNRRTFATHALAVLAAGSVSGCSFMSYVTREKPSTYREQVSSVLISEGDATLVVMTKEHHYVFPGPAPLPFALKSEIHPHVSAAISSFHVSSQGETSGILELTISNAAPREVLSESMNHGFTDTPNGAVFFKMLKGSRYGAGDIPAIPRYALNRTYDIEVSVDRGPTVLKTPIYLVRGALYIAGAALVVPLFYASCAISPCK